MGMGGFPGMRMGMGMFGGPRGGLAAAERVRLEREASAHRTALLDVMVDRGPARTLSAEQKAAAIARIRTLLMSAAPAARARAARAAQSVAAAGGNAVLQVAAVEAALAQGK